MLPERFGIKEVADVKFYEICDSTTSGAILGEGGVYHKSTALLTLDTLKVSNIESTAEQAEARGGKGNAPLIIWDYGREITVTLEDALLSMDTLALMFENNVNGGANNEIVIGANTYPGTYYVEGSTFARNEATGKDEPFEFIIPKAKIQSEVTLTMEAEGDPTVFNMTLRVLRCSDAAKTMMVLKKTPRTESSVSAQYYLTFVYDSGKVVTIPANGTTDTQSTLAPSDATWSPTPASTVVTSNARFVEVID